MHIPIPEITGMSPIPLLDGYLSEVEYARQRGVSLRTCQRDRALRQSPPYVVIGRQVYYRIEAIREWLLTRESHSTRLPQSIQNRRGQK
jgi:hypothetical protein